jgi:hypothetical protein
VIVPHVGWQFVPLAFRVQVTPALAESFWTLALKTMLLLLAGTVVTLFRIETEIAACEIVKLSKSDCALFAIEVAVIFGELLGELGTVAGGLYVTLVVVLPDRVPQAGEQVLPLAVRLQLTPLLVESFCTVALSTNGSLPGFMVVTLLVIVTDTAAVTVNASVSVLAVFATEVAVSVGWLAGEEAGGVYVTLVVVAEDKEPQVGEQLEPLAVRVQVTPLLLESFCTVALNEIAAVPA